MTDLFKEKSKDWDGNDFRTMLSNAISSSILDNVSLNEEMSVMDFGAGTGLICSPVAPKVKKIVAVDISQAMLDQLVSKSELDGKVEAVCQNILEQPLEQRFDLIMSAMALHHVEDTSSLLTTFGLHLNTGGKIALADLDEEDGDFHPENTEGVFHFGFERKELTNKLENLGFNNIQFFTAHTIKKPEKDYSIFLVTADKK